MKPSDLTALPPSGGGSLSARSRGRGRPASHLLGVSYGERTRPSPPPPALDEADLYEEENEDDEDDVELDECNVFVKFLPPEVTDTGLRALFARCGDIVSCRVMLDPVTRHSLGYGFVRFTRSEDAAEAIREVSGQPCGAKRLLVKLSQASSRGNAAPSDNLYLKPLPRDLDEDLLRALFAQYGEVLAVRILRQRRVGGHLAEAAGIGFVRFSTVDHAVKARSEMNGYKFSDEAEPLVVKFAEARDQRHVRRAKLRSNQTRALMREHPEAVEAHTLPRGPPTPPPLAPTSALAPPFVPRGELMVAAYPLSAELHLSGLPPLAPESLLATLCAPFGPLLSVQSPTPHLPRARIRFARVQDASRAQQALNGAFLGEAHLSALLVPDPPVLPAAPTSSEAH